MNKYFYVYNDFFSRSIIDDNYKNFTFSRKILAKDLPIVTVSEANGYIIKGSLQLRYVDIQNDESFVAVGRDFGERMVHYIFKALKRDNGSLKMENFVCAAEYINSWYGPNSLPYNWINGNKTISTGIQYPYTVPDDLYVYIFAETPRAVSENFGFQMLKPSGNSSEVVFDSRHKYLDVICLNEPYDSNESYLIDNKKIAIGTAYSSIDVIPHDGLANSGAVLFERGYTDPEGRVYSTMHLGAGARVLVTGSAYHYATDFGWGSPTYAIDVTGF